MKKTLIILSVLALIASSCGQTKKQTEAENEVSKETVDERHLIKETGVDIFLLGEKISLNAGNYILKKETMFGEEGIEVPFYVVSENEQKILHIIPAYNYKTNQYTDKIGEIIIFSEKFKTAESIGIGSTIENFVNTYPDFKIWYTYISEMYVIETKQYNFQFFLDYEDLIDKAGLSYNSDMTRLRLSDFKKNSKIKGIRIFETINVEEEQTTTQVNFSGNWSWVENNDNQGFSIELNQKGNEITGTHIAIAQGGLRIDTNDDEETSITGTVSGDGTAVVKITSGYSGETSKATIKFIDKNTIQWSVAQSDNEYYFPDKAVLKKITNEKTHDKNASR